MVKSLDRLFFLVVFCLGLSCWCTAQEQRVYDNDHPVLLATITGGVSWPGADMAKRFDRNLSVGLAPEWITKNNWIFGVDYQFHFGRFVREDVIANLRTPDGLIVGNTRSFAAIVLRQRGFYAGAHVAKLINLDPNSNRSGLRLGVGMGLLQHKIRIQDDPESFVPSLDETYKKGYDRLTNGLAFQQFVGYQLLSSNRLINFYLGFEFTQGFTQNRRSFNFDTRTADTAKRLDLLYAIKIGWSLPFYIGESGEEIFY
ncbi:MAG: hypothetical protein AAFV95_24975 [Bacteroidota bacterium]